VSFYRKNGGIGSGQRQMYFDKRAKSHGRAALLYETFGYASRGPARIYGNAVAPVASGKSMRPDTKIDFRVGA